MYSMIVTKIYQINVYSLLFVLSILGNHAFPSEFQRKTLCFTRHLGSIRLSRHSNDGRLKNSIIFPIRSLHLHFSASNTEISNSIEDFVRYFKKSVVKCAPTSHKEKKNLLNELMVWIPHLTSLDLIKVMNGVLLLKLTSRSKVLHLYFWQYHYSKLMHVSMFTLLGIIRSPYYDS